MRCPKCGRVNRDDALYCWNCHVRFAEHKPQPEDAHPREVHAREIRLGEESNERGDAQFKRKAGYLLLALGAALAIVLGIAAYYFFRMS